jgi:Arc/MetJ family transcription regulator
MASFDARIDASTSKRHRMRTTLALDDELLARAQQLTGLNERTALVREALQALIQRESARRLARLGGTEPKATAAPRRGSAAK